MKTEWLLKNGNMNFPKMTSELIDLLDEKRTYLLNLWKLESDKKILDADYVNERKKIENVLYTINRQIIVLELYLDVHQ
jgi:hypothetical protein